MTERVISDRIGSSHDQIYRDLFESAPFGFVLTNLDGIIQEANQATGLMLGVSQDSLIGRPLIEFVFEEPEERQVFNASLARLQTEQTHQAWAVRLRTADGGSFYAAANVTVLPKARNDDGTPILRWVLRDITRPIQTEGMARQSEQKLTGIFEHSMDGILLADERGRIVEWNNSMERITGLARADVLGKFFAELAYHLIGNPQSAQRIFERMQSRWTDTTQWTGTLIEIEIQRPDHTRCVVQQTVFPIATKQGPMLGSIMRDITERKNMENALRRANEELDTRVQERTLALTQAIHGLQAEIARRLEMENSLNKRLRIENIISTISHHFVTLTTDEIAHEINRALKLVGESSGVDRAYVFLLSNTRTAFEQVYEWCAEGIEARTTDLLDASPELVTRYVALMRRFEKNNVPRGDDPVAVSNEENELLGKYRVQSFILMPMHYQGKLIGGLGFDVVRSTKDWLNEDVTLFQIVAEILASTLEHHRAERVLRESENRQAAILNSVPVILYTFQMDNGRPRLTWMSPNVEQITGFPVSRFMTDRMFWISRMHPDDQPLVLDQLREFNQYVSKPMEYRWQCADGSYHWFLERVDGVVQNNSQVYVGTWLDITTRKRAEEAERAQRLVAEVLRDTAESFGNLLDMDQVIQVLLTSIVRVVPCDGANVVLVTDGLLHRTTWQGYVNLPTPNLGQDSEVLETHPSLQQMFATGQPLFVPDTAADANWVRHAQSVWIRSYIGVPIRRLGKTIGFLNVDSATPNFFTAVHVERLKAITNQASVALSNAQLFAETRQKADRLRALSQCLVEAQEVERGRIARELHDESGQILTALMVDLHYMERHAGETELIRNRVADAKRLTNNALEGLHQLVVDLHPPSLERADLVTALRQYIDGFNRQYHVPVEFDDASLERLPLPNAVEIALYRIVQEALTNVARHAYATRAEVLLSHREDRLRVMIWDDGCGFDPTRPLLNDRMGLVGMRERAEMLGGQFSVESNPTQGTMIRVEIPYVRSNSDR
jgi:PAS domain S-box-containing protein